MSSTSQVQLTNDTPETNRQHYDSHRKMHMSHILSSIAAVTDMVYVLCTKCNALRIPQGVHNIILTDGKISDQCLDLTLGHSRKVGFVHKAVVAHAVSKNFSNVTIIEEGLVINPMYKQPPDFTKLARQIQLRVAHNHKQLVRFTSLPWNLNGENGQCRNQGCTCHSLTPELCLLPRGCSDVHDSSFYMIHNTLFDDFIAADHDVLDVGTFAAFDSMLVTPPITLKASFECGHYDEGGVYQPGQCGIADQDSMWRRYNRTCVVPASAAFMCCARQSVTCCGPS
jgi:hypothetical protein